MADPTNPRMNQANDYYHSFRFQVTDDAGGSSFIQSANKVVAGFSHCTMPEHNIDHIEYSEGTWTYSKMFAGRSTFTTIVLSRGVAVADTIFANWVLAAAEGHNYRTDVTIVNFHRADIVGMAPDWTTNPQATASYILVAKNCIPIRFRPGSDFDPLLSDISINEIEFQPEYFKIGKAATPGVRAT